MAFQLISHPVGATFSRAYSGFRDEYGAAVTNFAGWSFMARLKESLEDSDAAALLSKSTDSWVINSTDGEVGFSFSASELSAALAPGVNGYIAVLAKTPSGFIGLIDEVIICLYTSAIQSIS